MASDGNERRVPANPIGLAGTRVLVAPFQLWLDGADGLRLEAWSSAGSTTVQAHGRVLLDDGTIDTFQTYIFAPNTATRVAKDLPMPKGFLLNAVVAVIGATPEIGQVFARLSVIRGITGAAIVYGTLVQGYVNASQFQSWPGTPLQQADSVPGYFTTMISLGAAPGNPLVFTVPSGVRWSVLTAAAGINTDATVATRRPYVRTISSDVQFFAHHTQTQLASSSAGYYWAQGLTGNVGLPGSNETAALPSRIELDEGAGVLFFATNFQAGDQFTGGSVGALERLKVT